MSPFLRSFQFFTLCSLQAPQISRQGETGEGCCPPPGHLAGVLCGCLVLSRAGSGFLGGRSAILGGPALGVPSPSLSFQNCPHSASHRATVENKLITRLLSVIKGQMEGRVLFSFPGREFHKWMLSRPKSVCPQPPRHLGLCVWLCGSRPMP